MKKLFTLFTICFLTIASNLIAQVSETEQKMSQYIDETNEAALDLLIKTININSGSMNFDGVREVGAVLRKEFDD